MACDKATRVIGGAALIVVGAVTAACAFVVGGGWVGGSMVAAGIGMVAGGGYFVGEVVQESRDQEQIEALQQENRHLRQNVNNGQAEVADLQEQLRVAHEVAAGLNAAGEAQQRRVEAIARDRERARRRVAQLVREGMDRVPANDGQAQAVPGRQRRGSAPGLFAHADAPRVVPAAPVEDSESDSDSDVEARPMLRRRRVVR